MKRNKKAQMGETITWAAATLIIILILTISIFVVSLNWKTKNFTTKNERSLVVSKTISGYVLTGNNYGTLKKRNMNEGTVIEGEDAKKIFTASGTEAYVNTEPPHLPSEKIFIRKLRGNAKIYLAATFENREENDE